MCVYLRLSLFSLSRSFYKIFEFYILILAKQWTLIHQWAKNVGLDIIVCIAPRYIKNESKMHSTNSINMTQLLSFNDLMGYNISWQLGYGKVSLILFFEAIIN